MWFLALRRALVALSVRSGTSASSGARSSPSDPDPDAESTAADTTMANDGSGMTDSRGGGMAKYAHEGHRVWMEVAPELTPADFNHPWDMCPAFLRRLSAARRACGVPFRIVSDYRPPDRNEAASGAARSAHLERPCRAVDLRALNNAERFRIVEALLGEGFERVGIYTPTEWQVSQYGRGAGSVHVDASPTNPSPSMWMTW